MSLAAVLAVPTSDEQGPSCDTVAAVETCYGATAARPAPDGQQADGQPSTAEHHRIFIARHGERADLVDPRWRDTAEYLDDPPLTERGLQQALELGLRLKGEAIRYIYASPFLRTAQTAHQVAAVLGLRVRLEWGLCEGLTKRIFPRGAPHVRSMQELHALLPRIDTSYVSAVPVTYPESYAQAQQRCQQAAQLIAERHPHDNVLLVGHGLSVEYLARALVTDQPCSLHIPYCALTECIRTPAGRDWRYGVHMQHDFLSVRQDPTDADKQRASWGLTSP